MSDIKSAVSTKNAPAPRAGIYSQAIIANGVIYTSGFTPVDPKTGKLVEGSIGNRTVSHFLMVCISKLSKVDLWKRQCIANITAVLDAAGTSINNAVKVNIYLTNMDDFDEVNKIYSEYWGEIKPSRT